MADITMCMGGECSLKATCFRFLATPEETDQTYFLNPPYVVNDGNSNCDFYWKINLDEDISDENQSGV